MLFGKKSAKILKKIKKSAPQKKRNNIAIIIKIWYNH